MMLCTLLTMVGMRCSSPLLRSITTPSHFPPSSLIDMLPHALCTADYPHPPLQSLSGTLNSKPPNNVHRFLLPSAIIYSTSTVIFIWELKENYNLGGLVVDSVE
jgi:hypothetical protein